MKDYSLYISTEETHLSGSLTNFLQETHPCIYLFGLSGFKQLSQDLQNNQDILENGCQPVHYGHYIININSMFIFNYITEWTAKKRAR